ncbi:peptide-methionine (S)-S-oxide reductase [Lacinutrix salivirga]
MKKLTKIAFGGGCHWCTEAVFQALKGVENVEQGYVASEGENSSFSEAVIVHFNPNEIKLKTLTEIHLLTHKSSSNHSMRTKYRSAIYAFSQAQCEEANAILESFQKHFDYKIVTKVYPFVSFKASREAIQNYYQKNPNKPFCETFISPKLKLLINTFSEFTNPEKLKHVI